ncbi:MAG: HEAT repeat domain-containing protein [Planctomycetota bacterium]|nr:HEAT repeat domain-containing protein [Planctomycetota bacterium]
MAIFLGGCGEDPATKVASADQSVRLEGLQKLPANNEKALATAIQATQHEDVVTARAAVRALRSMPAQKEAATALAKVAATDRRPEIREEATMALGYCPPENSAEALCTVIEKDAAPQVRAAAAIGMSRVGTLKDVEFLLRTCEREKDPIVQYQTIGALEKILGIGFTFDPRLPEDRRKVTMERIRITATIRAKALRDRRLSQR